MILIRLEKWFRIALIAIIYSFSAKIKEESMNLINLQFSWKLMIGLIFFYDNLSWSSRQKNNSLWLAGIPQLKYELTYSATVG